MIVSYSIDEDGKVKDIHFIGAGTKEDKEKLIKELREGSE